MNYYNGTDMDLYDLYEYDEILCLYRIKLVNL